MWFFGIVMLNFGVRIRCFSTYIPWTRPLRSDSASQHNTCHAELDSASRICIRLRLKAAMTAVRNDRALCFWPHVRKQDHITNTRAIRNQHD